MTRYLLPGIVFAGVAVVGAHAFAQTPTAPLPAGTQAQTPISVAELRKALGDPVTVTATVSAIDYDSRVVVLRDKDGTDHAMYVGEDIKRFANIKSGDTVKATYYMSLASRILQPGETGTPGLTERVVGTTGTTPGGTASAQQRWEVTVNAVDTTQNTITVTGEKGRTFTFKVEDPARLTGVKAGDRLEVVLTAALLVSVEPS